MGHTPSGRMARAAATLIAAALLVVVSMAPPAAQAGTRMRAMPVETRTIALVQNLPVAPLPMLRAWGEASAATPARLGAPPAASPTTLTLDPGRRFTMLGFFSDLPRAEGAVVLRLRSSTDGQSWSDWYAAPQIGRAHV